MEEAEDARLVETYLSGTEWQGRAGASSNADESLLVSPVLADYVSGRKSAKKSKSRTGRAHLIDIPEGAEPNEKLCSPGRVNLGAELQLDTSLCPSLGLGSFDGDQDSLVEGSEKVTANGVVFTCRGEVTIDIVIEPTLDRIREETEIQPKGTFASGGLESMGDAKVKEGITESGIDSFGSSSAKIKHSTESSMQLVASHEDIDLQSAEKEVSWADIAIERHKEGPAHSLNRSKFEAKEQMDGTDSGGREAVHGNGSIKHDKHKLDEVTETSRIEPGVSLSTLNVASKQEENACNEIESSDDLQCIPSGPRHSVEANVDSSVVEYEDIYFKANNREDLVFEGEGSKDTESNPISLIVSQIHAISKETVEMSAEGLPKLASGKGFVASGSCNDFSSVDVKRDKSGEVCQSGKESTTKKLDISHEHLNCTNVSVESESTVPLQNYVDKSTESGSGEDKEVSFLSIGRCPDDISQQILSPIAFDKNENFDVTRTLDIRCQFGETSPVASSLPSKVSRCCPSDNSQNHAIGFYRSTDPISKDLLHDAPVSTDSKSCYGSSGLKVAFKGGETTPGETHSSVAPNSQDGEISKGDQSTNLKDDPDRTSQEHVVKPLFEASTDEFLESTNVAVGQYEAQKAMLDLISLPGSNFNVKDDVRSCSSIVESMAESNLEKDCSSSQHDVHDDSPEENLNSETTTVSDEILALSPKRNAIGSSDAVVNSSKSSPAVQLHRDLSSAKKRLDANSRALLERLRGAAEMRKMSVARSRDSLAAKEQQQLTALSPSRTSSGFQYVDDVSTCRRSQNAPSASSTYVEKRQYGGKDPYVPFKARPLPATTGDLGHGGQLGIPKISKRSPTTPVSPKLGLRRPIETTATPAYGQATRRPASLRQALRRQTSTPVHSGLLSDVLPLSSTTDQPNHGELKEFSRVAMSSPAVPASPKICKKKEMKKGMQTCEKNPPNFAKHISSETTCPSSMKSLLMPISTPSPKGQFPGNNPYVPFKARPLPSTTSDGQGGRSVALKAINRTSVVSNANKGFKEGKSSCQKAAFSYSQMQKLSKQAEPRLNDSAIPVKRHKSGSEASMSNETTTEKRKKPEQVEARRKSVLKVRPISSSVVDSLTADSPSPIGLRVLDKCTNDKPIVSERRENVDPKSNLRPISCPPKKPRCSLAPPTLHSKEQSERRAAFEKVRSANEQNQRSRSRREREDLIRKKIEELDKLRESLR